MENQRLDFGEIVRKIAEDKMLLPDFQRGFVWKDEEQRKIVASVLAKMPIGSILLLKSKPDEYASKKGTKAGNLKPVHSCNLKPDPPIHMQVSDTILNIFYHSY